MNANLLRAARAARDLLEHEDETYGDIAKEIQRQDVLDDLKDAIAEAEGRGSVGEQVLDIMRKQREGRPWMPPVMTEAEIEAFDGGNTIDSDT